MANEKRLIDPKKALYLAEHSGLYDFDLSSLETLLLDEPCITVEAVEVVHGRWIPGEFEGEYTCSRCGMEYCEADPRERPYKYCPECGSKNE